MLRTCNVGNLGSDVYRERDMLMNPHPFPIPLSQEAGNTEFKVKVISIRGCPQAILNPMVSHDF
jgi:hypothetical protein